MDQSERIVTNEVRIGSARGPNEEWSGPFDIGATPVGPRSRGHVRGADTVDASAGVDRRPARPS